MKQRKKLKIFVTGAMGFIGQHWCIKLLENNHNVVGLDLKKKILTLINIQILNIIEIQFLIIN
tara:strand:+ start:140 stop:328 length:189 start_codon:yes stop_codon:yes gene_type:complete